MKSRRSKVPLSLGSWSRARRLGLIALGFVVPALIFVQGVHVLTYNPDACFGEKLPPETIAQFNHLKTYYDHPDLATADQWDSRNDLNLMVTEWPVFCNSFFTMAMRDMALADPSFKPQAVRYMRLAIEEMMRRRTYGYIVGRYGNPFDEKVPLKDNALYLGHLNVMLGSYRKLSGDGRFDKVHHRISKALFENVMASPTGNIESYPSEVWPCDNAFVMASLKYHDDVFKTHYSVARRRWIAFYRTHLDPKTGIMPAFISNASGEAMQPPRSVCLGYSLPLIAEFDPKFAREQWMAAKRSMFDSRFGFGAMREYPRGIETAGDIDTGPLIGGFGPASSAFMLASAKSAGDREAFDDIMRTGETIAFPLSLFGSKRYLISARVGDTIALWAKTRPPFYSSPEPKQNRTGSTVAGLAMVLIALAIAARLKTEFKTTLRAHRKELDSPSRKLNIAGFTVIAVAAVLAICGAIPLLYVVLVLMLIVLVAEKADESLAARTLGPLKIQRQ